MNVIRLIERMGEDAHFDIKDAVAACSDVDPAIAEALANKDQSALEALLGTDTNLMMVLVPAEDDDEDEEPEQEANRLVG